MVPVDDRDDVHRPDPRPGELFFLLHSVLENSHDHVGFVLSHAGSPYLYLGRSTDGKFKFYCKHGIVVWSNWIWERFI